MSACSFVRIWWNLTIMLYLKTLGEKEYTGVGAFLNVDFVAHLIFSHVLLDGLCMKLLKT